jgi:hypothetical protein
MHESGFSSQSSPRVFNPESSSAIKDATGRSNSDPTPDACNRPPMITLQKPSGGRIIAIVYLFSRI